MRSYTYTVAEHHPARPWILVGEIRHLTVELEDGQNFYEWAVTEWPGPRFKVELDPWQTPGSSSAIAPERAPKRPVPAFSAPSAPKTAAKS